MKSTLTILVSFTLLLGCDRLLPSDDPPPAPVAPLSPPTVVLRTNAAPDELALFVDGQASGTLSDGRSLQLEPGPHAIEARRGNEVVARAEQTLTSGQQVEVTLNRPDPPGATGSPEPPPTAAAEAAGVTFSEVEPEGDAPPALAAQLARQLRARSRAIRACYERRLSEFPADAASYRVVVTVRPTGTIGGAEADPPTPAVDDCVLAPIRRMRFTPSSATAGGRYAFSVTLTPPSTAAEAALPERDTPSRGDLVAAMRAVEPAVRACGTGRSGIVPVRFSFRGDGAVESASVSGGSHPAGVRSCIERAAGQARLPPFRNETFSVNYPFRL